MWILGRPKNKKLGRPKCALLGRPKFLLSARSNFHCLQVCWFFPLHEQIKRLIENDTYRELLMYENTHRRKRRNDNFMCDIYDSPRWKQVAGPLTQRLNRIVLHVCVDACPAHARKQCGSVKPIQYFIGNLAPWLRYCGRHMLIHALIPAHLKGKKAKKYYDWIGVNEMKTLYRHGVNGVRVIMYGNTLDTPGRREILSMQSVTAFYPCPHCLHTWQPGLRGQVYGGYRRFLAPESPWRHKQFVFMGHSYQFRDIEFRYCGQTNFIVLG